MYGTFTELSLNFKVKKKEYKDSPLSGFITMCKLRINKLKSSGKGQYQIKVTKTGILDITQGKKP